MFKLILIPTTIFVLFIGCGSSPKIVQKQNHPTFNKSAIHNQASEADKDLDNELKK